MTEKSKRKFSGWEKRRKSEKQGHTRESVHIQTTERKQNGSSREIKKVKKFKKIFKKDRFTP